MAKSVYLLYEGDSWLSTDSLVLMGVFTNQKKLRMAARKLIKMRLKNNFDETRWDNKTEFINEQMNQLFGTHWNSGQTSDGEVLFMITEVETNKLEEVY